MIDRDLNFTEENDRKQCEILLGDDQVEKSFYYYAPLCCESLCMYLKPVIDNHINTHIVTYVYIYAYLVQGC